MKSFLSFCKTYLLSAIFLTAICYPLLIFGSSVAKSESSSFSAVVWASDEVRLSWAPYLGADFDRYELYRFSSYPTPAIFQIATIKDKNITNLTDINLKSETGYTYELLI